MKTMQSFNRRPDQHQFNVCKDIEPVICTLAFVGEPTKR